MCTFRYNGDSGLYHKIEMWSNIAEIIFAIDLIANFFKVSHNVHKEHDEKKFTFNETYSNYLSGEFKWDLIPLIPLQLLVLTRNRQRIFFVIKMVRIRKTYKEFGKEFVMKYAKDT
jgi:hypothetical protein